jgi:hypothetical protein
MELRHIWNSVPRGSGPRESTPGWKVAHVLAYNALTLAVEAGAKAANRDEAANEKTEEALRCLQERLGLYFHLGLQN